MKILFSFIILLILSLPVKLKSQTDDSLYLPLTVGNKWFYNTVTSGGFPTVYGHFIMSITEEKYIAGKKYFKCEKYWEGYDTIWIRFNKLTGYLVKYDSSFLNCENEVNLYKFNAIPGDTIRDQCTINSYSCVLLQDTTLFGITSKIKMYNITNIGWAIYIRNWHFLKNLGLIFNSSVSGRNNTIHSTQTLRGAIINGVLYGDTSLIGITTISNTVPKSYLLLNNFPNPFNSSTKIQFQIIKSDYTKLTVYNILGEEINILVNRFLKPGKYEIDYNTMSLTSGVYFYKLTAGEFTQTKSMILVK
ncbi:MAG: T9SS type A sorting domain-containing protein [Ignavibacteria bacterium]|nr:T9SS type A sorting domain-containing protein [Ignavibacteria bacterium]